MKNSLSAYIGAIVTQGLSRGTIIFEAVLGLIISLWNGGGIGCDSLRG